ncbi:MAG TPA: hypothetical protein DDZ88_19100 [Verrucomicrobiales bacterium]|nr:hypothetical protein [Verrucomicrobiales bacterium]
MNFSSLITLGLAALLMLSSCAPSQHYIDLHHKKYRVKGAQDAKLGRIGIMPFALNGFSGFENKLPADVAGLHLDAYRFKKDETQNSKFAAQLDAAALHVAKVAGNIDLILEEARSGNYILHRLASTDALIDKLKSQPKALEWLAKDKKRDRIVTGVIVVYNNKELKTLKGSASVTGSVVGMEGKTDDKTPILKLTGSNGHTSTFGVGDGQIVAYEIMRPIWGKDGTLSDLSVDNPSFLWWPF